MMVDPRYVENGDYDILDESCGTCGLLFEDCMCCSCGEEDGHRYPEGVFCEECIKFERGND